MSGIQSKYRAAINAYTVPQGTADATNALVVLKTFKTAGDIVSEILASAKDKDKAEYLKIILNQLKLLANIKLTSTSTSTSTTQNITKNIDKIFAEVYIKHKAFHVYLLLKPIIDLQEVSLKIDNVLKKLTDANVKLLTADTTCKSSSDELTAARNELEKVKNELNIYKEYATKSLPLHDSLAAINIPNPNTLYTEITTKLNSVK